jgi:type III restriction enzyme
MNRHVNAIAGRLSLRPPQRESLEILDRVCEIVPPRSSPDLETALAKINEEFSTVENFERDFLSVCFALATGVGKTRLMGAFITYLHLVHGIKNFFVLAPNLTIYDKLITDFTPNTPKYVFKGIAEFATDAPEIITGENYEKRARTLFDELIRCKINIFNISKINSEVRGGKSPRIKRLSEYIGESYFEFLSNLDDLVILMDESHRYRASAGVRAINELKPILGLELTATPFVETGRGAIQFQNVIYDYPLGRAIADGFVKDPAVVTRKDFNPAGMSTKEIERLKLEDGVRLHESIKAKLITYARETDQYRVKPFVLVIARDTSHAAQLLELIESEEFFAGRYAGKVIQVDSSTKGKKEDEMIERLLKVEQLDEPTEIVIHVNMLKEGWDVTNLYTIVPLRAASARILIEQSIGRGLRLPYGKRTGVKVVDRLNIIAHDKFQEIIDAANQADSVIRLKRVILEPDDLENRQVSVAAKPNISSLLGQTLPEVPGSIGSPSKDTTEEVIVNKDKPPAFATPQEQEVAQITYEVIQELERKPELVPTTTHLKSFEIQSLVRERVEEKLRHQQLKIEGVSEQPDLDVIIDKTTDIVIQQTIDIPRILVFPTGEVRTGFRSFALDCSAFDYEAPSDVLIQQSLSTGDSSSIGAGEGGIQESRLEDYIVRGLIDFDDIAYDAHADLLYDLAGQVVNYLSELSRTENEIRAILKFFQRDIVRDIHAQMQDHFWEDAVEYEETVSRGFTALKDSSYTSTQEKPLNYRHAPKDKSKMQKYLFGGFSRCLYPVQKFDSDTERLLAIILEKEALKWFRPAKGQFQIYYRWNGEHPEYQPDFVAETDTTVLMLEAKMSSQMTDPQVLAKKEVAIRWCQQASNYMEQHGGKPWRYALIPHSAIAENMTLKGLVERYS